MQNEMTRRRLLKNAALLPALIPALAGRANAGALKMAGDAKAPEGETPMPNEKSPPKWAILNHDERMSYRRLGKTGLWISAVSLGGHWKRCPFQGADFEKNRTEILARCIDAGFNYVDACSYGEVITYARALKAIGKRERIYFGFDSCGARSPDFRTRTPLLKSLDATMLETGLDYVDVWRITCHEPGGLHTYNEACEIAAAGEQAIKEGKVRVFGLSTHDRRWAEFMIREFPIVSVIITPYTPGTTAKPEGSFFETVRKQDVGVFGIKPFASNALFRGTSQPGDPHEKEDNEAARLAIRHVLSNDAITSPIPGLIFPSHVENCLQAIEERRRLDLVAKPVIREDPRLDRVARGMWERLPAEYEWLREWRCV